MTVAVVVVGAQWKTQLESDSKPKSKSSVCVCVYVVGDDAVNKEKYKV